jgi:hypothetical protein
LRFNKSSLFVVGADDYSVDEIDGKGSFSSG